MVEEDSLEAKVAEQANCREEYEGHEVANGHVSNIIVRIGSSFGDRSYRSVKAVANTENTS